MSNAFGKEGGSMSKVRYRWATLGCGVIGNELARAMQALGGGLYAVGNRTQRKAQEFAAQYGIPKVYERMEDVFDARSPAH